MNRVTILVIEDESDIREILRFNLEKAGFEVRFAEDGFQGLSLASAEQPDLIVLDLMLPGLDGKEVCRRMRQESRSAEIPIIMLTALGEEVDRIVGLELGADDYVTKPFSPRELILRIQAILRRGVQIKDKGPLRLAGLSIDTERHQVEAEGNCVDLTATEFKLLKYLAENAGRVMTREVLLDKVWGYSFAGYGRTVDTHIRRLRQKLGSAAELIETIRGMGYRLKDE